MIRLLLVCVATAFVALTPSRLAAQAPTAVPSAVPSATGPVGGVRIVNRSGTARQIELRAGSSGGCAAGPAVSRQSVAAGATIVIRSSQPLCLRRPLASVQGASITGEWELTPMRRGVIEVIIL